MISHTVRVNLGPRSYEIAITSDDLTCLAPFARNRCTGNSAFIVRDSNVGDIADAVAQILSAAGFRTAQAVLTSGEKQKSLHTVSELYDRLTEFSADRQTVVVAVGGGVVGDVAGFTAATYARGLPLLMLPTTLLAMVDSSVGGKTGVNHPTAKNLIGAFHQPIGVWIDTEFLKTLPDREYRSGLAEVVKYGVILDPELFEFLETNSNAILNREPAVIRHIVSRCCRLKADIVEQDEREETGLRSILNYGHTFAHAFEAVAGYGHWQHGEAVAAGMIYASCLAHRRGLIPDILIDRQRRLLEIFTLPTVHEGWPADELLAAMRRDKKSQGDCLRLVLPRRLGEVALYDNVTEPEVRAILSS